MGFTHQQRQIRDRTIDARPNDPGEITDPVIALNYLIEGLEARIARLEGLVTQLSRDALRDAVDASLVTRDTTRDASDAQRVTRDAAIKRHAHAERQRQYRERKKHGAADSER